MYIHQHKEYLHSKKSNENNLPFGVENKHKTRILFSATPCSLSVRMARFTVEPDAFIIKFD